jgi:modulator of FtsH protease
MDPYQPQPWHDYFLAIAGASAALAGLLFVATSLHVRYIATSPDHRGRSRDSLSGLIIVLVLSLVTLVPQPTVWFGLELIVIVAGYIAVGGAFQLAEIRGAGRHLPRSVFKRTGFGYLLAVAGVLAGLSITLRTGPGLYLLGIILVVVLLWSLWNAWVLLMGVADEEIAAEKDGG